MYMFKLVLTLVQISTSAFAGELSRRDIRRSTEWEPTNCWRPTQPTFYIYDTASFNQAVEDYNSYLSEVEQYIDCTNGEASDDFKTLKRILEQSLDEKISEIQNELRDARDSLESQWP